MVAKKIMPQIQKPLALHIHPRKMEVIMIQMGAVLLGETGGKDLSTTK
ncbi:hypothetical protein HanHA300_Chr07g0256811 [Helianthus annuus]|nr:hypothetical protein HanHA300_Chr07g0256811 [Helianthus annuus]KAJ0558440.1 hypothetical protein HanIR_Chr07g0336391 [Helianthus annuus]KAJ0732435.1 hypothetical protein HanOQP8_Chr07g0263191 [Helianthus annuus]